MRGIFRVVALLLLVAAFWEIPAHASGRSYSATVTMLADEKYYDALSAAILRARKEIRGCFFLFKTTTGRDNLPMALVDELIAARRRGVTVSIELEQDPLGKGSVYEQNRRAAALLSAGGVKVRFDVPKITTHVKAMVIDGRYVFLGSHNLTQSALKFNNELSVMVDSREFAAEVASYLDNL